MHCLGWADDSQLPNKRPDSADAWQTGFGGGAYTTGRRGRSRAPLPALPPGKINLSDYNHVSAALGRLQVCFFVRKISCSQCKLISHGKCHGILPNVQCSKWQFLKCQN